MEENKRISDLFERARTEAPKTSFEEVKKHVVAASTVGSVGILAKWAALSFKLKSIIMVTTLSTLTISTLLVISQFNESSGKAENSSISNRTQSEHNLEIHSENGIQKTIVYDENNSIVEVIVDSSDQLDADGESIRYLSPVELLPFETVEVINEDLEGIELVEGTTPLVDVEKDSLVMKRFDISDKTTEEELDQMQAAAADAGISIQFNARIRRGTLKRLSLVMSILEDGKRKYKRSCVYKAKTFSFQTGWMEDKNGQVIRFLNKDEVKPFCAKY